jgi:hypothetical protein
MLNRYLPNLIVMDAATVAVNSGNQVNENCRGIQLVIRNTAGTGTTPTLTVTIQGFDPASGQYYTLLASTAIAAGTPATTVLTVYPGLAATANVSASNVLPFHWRVLTAIGGTGTPTVTATISAHLIK